MTNQEAIKYLQQLYPNGGHCWLDEQRIEAVGMTVKALQEEPVSEDLGDYINELSKQFPEVSFAKLSRIAVRVAKLQQEQMMKDAIDGEIYFNLDALQYRIITEPLTGYHHGDKIKLTIVKEN